MSVSTDIARLNIIVDSIQARNARRDLEDLNRAGAGADESLGRLSGTASQLGKIFASLALAKKLFDLVKVIKDLSVQAVLMNARWETLGVVMNVVGANAGYTSTQLAIFEKGLIKSGIAMSEARLVLTRMSQAQIDLTQAQKLGRIAQDAAVIGNINSSEALKRMIYGIQTAQIEVLRNIGINVNFEQTYKALAKTLGTTADRLTVHQKLQARVNTVMEIGSSIAGVYEEAMYTASKQLASMTRYSDDLKVRLGEVFNDTFTTLIWSMTDAFKAANEQMIKLKDSGDLEAWSVNLAHSVFAAVGVLEQIYLGIKKIRDINKTLEADKEASTAAFLDKFVGGSMAGLKKLGIAIRDFEGLSDSWVDLIPDSFWETSKSWDDLITKMEKSKNVTAATAAEIRKAMEADSQQPWMEDYLKQTFAINKEKQETIRLNKEIKDAQILANNAHEEYQKRSGILTPLEQDKEYVEQYGEIEKEINKLNKAGIDYRIETKRLQIAKYAESDRKIVGGMEILQAELKKLEDQRDSESIAAAKKKNDELDRIAEKNLSEHLKIVDEFETAFLQSMMSQSDYETMVLKNKMAEYREHVDGKIALKMYETKTMQEIEWARLDDEEEQAKKTEDAFAAGIEERFGAQVEAYDERTKAEQDFQDEQKKLREDAYKDFSDTIQSNTADILRDWDNAWETMTDIMKDALIEMAAEALTTNIIVPIAMEIGSAMGLSWDGVPMSSMTGGSSGTGLIGSIQSLWSGAQAGYTALTTEGGFSNMAESIYPWLGNYMTGSTTTGVGASVTGAGASGAEAIGVTGSGQGVTYGEALYGSGSGSILAGAGVMALLVGVGNGWFSDMWNGSAGAPRMVADNDKYDEVSLVDRDGNESSTFVNASGSNKNIVESDIYRPGKLDDFDFSFYENTGGFEDTVDFYRDYLNQFLLDFDSAISEVSVNDIISESDIDFTRKFDGTGEEMTGWILDSLFTDMRASLVSNAFGIDESLLPEDFFRSIIPTELDEEGNEILGTLFDGFDRFYSVIGQNEDALENFTYQITEMGLSADVAFANIEFVSGVLAMAEESLKSIASSSTITTLEEIVDVYDAYMQSMEDAMATQEEITQVQDALYQEIGSSVTGLTADSFQNAMIEASQSGGTVTESIKTMLNTSMAQAVAGAASESIFEAFLAPINEQIGAIVAGSIVDGVLTDSATMIESIGTIIDAVDWNGIEDAVSGAMDVLDGLSDVDITTTAAESNIGTTDLTPYGGWVSTVNAAGDGVTWAWAEDSRPESSDVESSDSIAEDQAQLNIELMYLQGDAAAALAMERQLELDAMDESLHATQKSIWALEDLADAENLNIELMYLQGDVSGAVAASRQLELNAMDESLWSAQGLIWALEDLADAENLNIELLEAQGESEKALAASRQLQLDAMDESLWATQQQIWAIEDEETARSEAVSQANMLISLLEAQGETESALTLSRQLELGAMNDAERAIQILIWSLEDAAESAQSVSDAEYDVSIARQDYITALQAEQNALQGIYDAAKTAYTDGIQRAIDAASEAQEGLQDVFDTARDAYIEGLQAEIDAQYELADVAQDAVDSFSDLADSIAEAKGQATDDMALLPDEQYALSRTKLQDAVDLTSSSDPEKVKEGLGLIPGLTSEFLSSSLAGNTDISAYQADYAYVMQLLNSSENIALAQVQTSQDALDEAENQVDELKDILDFVENGAEDTRSLLELQTEYNAANREHDISWYGDEITRLEGILDFVENGAEDTRSLFELETDYNAAKTALDNSWYADQITALGLIDGSVLSLEEAEEGYFAALTTAVNLGSTASSTELGLILDAINALNISSNITTINTTNDNSTDIEDSGSHDVYTYGSGDGVSFISLDGNAYTADAVTDFLLGSTASTIDAVMAEYGIDWSTLAGLVNSSRDADTTFTGDDVQTYVQDTNGVSLDGIMYSPDAVLDFITNAPYSDVMDVMSTYGISYDDIANATNRTGPGYSYTGADVEEYLSTRGFADGGTVFSPMMALVGEGGEAEHITPDSQMKGVKDQLKEIKEVLIMMMNTNGNQSKYAQKMWRILDDSQRGERPLTTEVAA